MKVSESDREKLVKELGMQIDIPAEIPRVWIVYSKNRTSRNFKREKFLENLDSWESRNFIIKRNGYDWPQIIAFYKSLDDFVVVALSTDLLAGVDSDSFECYFILTKSEYKDIECFLLRDIRDQKMAINLILTGRVTQSWKGNQIYRNYFDPVCQIDCQDDGFFEFIAPKRRLPSPIREALKDYLEYMDWDNFEYNSEDFTGTQEIIILRDVFETRKRTLEEINEIIKRILEIEEKN